MIDLRALLDAYTEEVVHVETEYRLYEPVRRDRVAGEAFAALRAVLDLHQPWNPVSTAWEACRECGKSPYPCPTVHDITKALEGKMSTANLPLHKLTPSGTAHDPAFTTSVIVPALEAKGLDVGFASIVAELMDTSGCDVDQAVQTLAAVVESYGAPPTVDGESLASDQRER